MPVVTIASGFAVSSAIAIRGDRGVVVAVASHAAAGWGCDFSLDGGTTWAPLRKPDGSGLVYAITSGTGPMIGIVDPPSNLMRLTTAAALVSTTSARVYDVNRV